MMVMADFYGCSLVVLHVHDPHLIVADIAGPWLVATQQSDVGVADGAGTASARRSKRLAKLALPPHNLKKAKQRQKWEQVSRVLTSALLQVCFSCSARSWVVWMAEILICVASRR